MAKNRYGKDYILEERADEKGRVRLICTYIGADYVFVCGAEEAKRLGKRIRSYLAAGWLLFLLPLFPQSIAMHRLYVSLPFILCALPMFLLVDFRMAFRNMKEPLEHRHADRLNNRYPPQAASLLVLPVLSLIGEAAAFISSRTYLPGDVLFVLCAAGLAVIGRALFRLRTGLAAQKAEAADAV